MTKAKTTQTPKIPGDEPETQTAAEEKDNLDALIDKKISARDAKRAKNARGPAPEAAELPRQQDVDRSKMTRPVLTRDGYLVPKEKAQRYLVAE